MTSESLHREHLAILQKYQVGGIVDITESSVIITPRDTNGCYMHASVRRTEDGYKVIKFSLKSRLHSGERHPYFQENRMSAIAHDVLKIFPGVDGIEFYWDKKSTNYQQYIAKRDAYVKEGVSYEEAKKKAASETWTGKMLALSNGYTKIQEVVEGGSNKKPDIIQGIFFRKDLKK